MQNLLFWLYLINAILLIIHEIDSARWQEWELFHLLGGASGFLILHVPLLSFVLYGLVLVERGSSTGLLFSLILGAAGIFAFSIHRVFLRRGDQGFREPISLGILWSTLLVSLLQIGAVTLVLWEQPR